MNFDFRSDFKNRYVADPTKLPKQPHNVIIVYEDVYVSDGYGGQNKESYARVYAFIDDGEWERAVQMLALDKDELYQKKPIFFAYKHVKAVSIAVKATVTVG